VAGRVSAKAVIINSDGKFLVLTNSYWPSNPGPAYAPDFPGGTLEPGETFEQGLVREVKEEIGIDLADAPKQQITQCGLPHIGYTVVMYIVWANIRDIHLDTEHCMFSWLTLEQMRAQPWWGGYAKLFREIDQHLAAFESADFVEYKKAISYA